MANVQHNLTDLYRAERQRRGV